MPNIVSSNPSWPFLRHHQTESGGSKLWRNHECSCGPESSRVKLRVKNICQMCRVVCSNCREQFLDTSCSKAKAQWFDKTVEIVLQKLLIFFEDCLCTRIKYLHLQHWWHSCLVLPWWIVGWLGSCGRKRDLNLQDWWCRCLVYVLTGDDGLQVDFSPVGSCFAVHI